MARTSRAKNQLKKKKPTLEDDTSIFPCDVIPNILSRLPVKSLMRFKSVSKPWNSIISDVGFAKVHLLQSKNSDCCEARVLGRSNHGSTETHHQLTFSKHGLQCEGTLEFPVAKYLRAPVLCSYDGLVLLKNTAKSDRRYVIWNTSTRKYTTILCPYPFGGMFIRYGICCNESKNDYKVLIMEDNHRYTVYSYNSDLWTQKPYSSNRATCNNKFVVVHGVPHWVVEEHCKEVILIEGKEHNRQLSGKKCTEFTWCAYSYHHYKNHPVYECDYRKTLEICYLDHRDDTVKKLGKPMCLDEICVFRLTSLKNQLCLYRNTYDRTMIEIWMMKEFGNPDSWIKSLTIENIPGPHVCHHAEPLCFTSEGDIVIEFDGAEYIIYSPSTKHFREAESQSYNYPHALLYLDSLVLPRRVNSSKGD